MEMASVWSSGLRAVAASMTPGRLSLLQMGFGIGVYGDAASGALFVRVGFCLRCSFSDGVCFLAGGGVLSAVAAGSGSRVGGVYSVSLVSSPAMAPSASMAW